MNFLSRFVSLSLLTSILVSGTAFAADVKISALPAASAAAGTEEIPVNQSGTTAKMTTAQVKTFTSASPTLVTPVLGVATGTSLALSSNFTLGGVLATSVGVNWSSTATAPAAANGATQAGKTYTITASPAVASLDTNGAAAGGAVTITSGDAARLVSGNADGGDIILASGAGIGTGVSGQVKISSAGTAARPSIYLVTDTGTGWYRDTSNSWTWTQAGSSRVTLGLGVKLGNSGTFSWSSASTPTGGAADTLLSRGAAANVQFGDVNAAAPVAQTISFQGARGGTDTNTAAVTTTIQGSLGTGTGASGNIVFTTGTPQTTGTAAHVSATMLTIKNTGGAGSANTQITIGSAGTAGTPALTINDTGTGWYRNALDQWTWSTNSGSKYLSLISGKMRFASSQLLNWNSTADSTASGDDTGLGRNAAAVVEVNNGTAGTFGQLALSGTQGNNTLKTLVETSATTFVKVTVASGGWIGGSVDYVIEANDASDFQARSGTIPFVAVNKAGTITCTVGTVGAATEVVAVSTGTLTNTFTCADATGNIMNLLANATSSLTQTLLRIRYRVNILNTSTVAAQ